MRQLVGDSEGVSEEQLRFLPLDLSSLKSVRAFAEAFQASGLDLHVLVLNAGAILQSRSISEDSLDMSMASNFFGHFLLVQLLLPSILATEKKGGSPRIVQVNSALAFEHGAFDFDEAVIINDESRDEFLLKDFKPFHVYGQTKVAGMMCLMELARRLRQRGSKVPVNAVHPGEILTDITRDMHWIIVWLTRVFRPAALFLMKDAPCGCTGTVYASTSEALATSDDMSGEFLMRLAPVWGCEAWLDKAANERLWNLARTVTDAPDVF
jgi:NAD(P)-dependent dehydrogenase (short-subunit alcohol dehydrogenase family)